MHRKNWQTTPNERICERHFLPAIPSIFNFPDHLQKTAFSRPPPSKRLHLQPNSSSVPKKLKKPNQNQRTTLDHTYANKISPRKLQAKYKMNLKKYKLRNLKKKNLRLEKNMCFTFKIEGIKLMNNFFAVQNLKMALKKANILQHTKSFFV